MLYLRSVWFQIVNYSHLFPTRYALELEGLKGSVSNDTFKEPSHREEAKKTIKKLFEERYTGGKNKWFFQPLRVSFFGLQLMRRSHDFHQVLNMTRVNVLAMFTVKLLYAS